METVYCDDLLGPTRQWHLVVVADTTPAVTVYTFGGGGFIAPIVKSQHAHFHFRLLETGKPLFFLMSVARPSEGPIELFRRRFPCKNTYNDNILSTFQYDLDHSTVSLQCGATPKILLTKHISHPPLCLPCRMKVMNLSSR